MTKKIIYLPLVIITHTCLKTWVCYTPGCGLSSSPFRSKYLSPGSPRAELIWEYRGSRLFIALDTTPEVWWGNKQVSQVGQVSLPVTDLHPIKHPWWTLLPWQCEHLFLLCLRIFASRQGQGQSLSDQSQSWKYQAIFMWPSTVRKALC